MIVRVEQRLGEAPDGEGREAEDDGADEDQPKGLAEQRQHRFLGGLGLRAADGREHGEGADDGIDHSAGEVAEPGESDER